MLEPSEAIRCPNCAKLVAKLSADFAGQIAYRCPRCKAAFGTDEPDLPPLACTCGRWLHSGRVEAGSISTLCRGCQAIVELTTVLPRRTHKQERLPKPRRLTDADFVALVEDRWQTSRVRFAMERASLAVGLRFDVFSRDGFRCTYCGRGPTDGVLLEADHVIPRAEGGEDTLANLRTACGDCNRGKSAKLLDSLTATG